MPPSDAAAGCNWPSDLNDCFEHLPAASHWLVALSGGLDSTFLLHCLALKAREQSAELSAVHINHGLQSQADQWAYWCERQCRELGVCLMQEHLSLDDTAPDLEARARRQRYQVFEQHLPTDGVLFMAHHADDQAETVLLRLMRGSGVRGLAGMPATRALGKGTLHRPLLSLRRERIESLARIWKLHWCEDHSNRDTRFDRNYLRHQVMPLLQARWPAAVERINRSAEHAGNADQLLDGLVRQDELSCSRNGRLSLSGLAELPRTRQEALIRYRLRAEDIPPPGERQLSSGLDALLCAQDDRQPEVRWQVDGRILTLRRYCDQLWLVPSSQEPLPETASWSPEQPLSWCGGRLDTEQIRGAGLKAPQERYFSVARRRGGERFCPAPGRPSQSLKKWLQQQQVPPWERDRLPLIFQGETLVAIADRWISPDWRASAGSWGYRLSWHGIGRPL